MSVFEFLFHIVHCVGKEEAAVLCCVFVCVDGCVEQEEDIRGSETSAQTTRTHTCTQRKEKEKQIFLSKTERKIMKVSC